MTFPRLDGPTASGVFTVLLGDGENRLDFEYIQRLHSVFAEVEKHSGPTAVVLTGADKFFCNGLDIEFAGGAMLALACDYRVMNKRRGFLCINEVDIGLPLTPGMAAVVKSKLDRSLWVSTVLSGRRWTAEEGAKHNFIDEACLPEDVLPKAQAIATLMAPKGERKRVYKALKNEMYSVESRALQSGVGEASVAMELLQRHAKM